MKPRKLRKLAIRKVRLETQIRASEAMIASLKEFPSYLVDQIIEAKVELAVVLHLISEG